MFSEVRHWHADACLSDGDHSALVSHDRKVFGHSVGIQNNEMAVIVAGPNLHAYSTHDRDTCLARVEALHVFAQSSVTLHTPLQQ